jgi:hypothetical protein
VSTWLAEESDAGKERHYNRPAFCDTIPTLFPSSARRILPTVPSCMDRPARAVVQGEDDEV